MLRLRRRPLRRLRRDAAGVSAVEFALILPIMLVLWAGMAELSHATINWRRVTMLARTVADLTSKGDTADPMASGTMGDILAASKAVLLPFPGTSAQIVVSALGVDTAASVLRPRVCSSIASSNAKARPAGLASDLVIPAGYNTNGNRYLLTEVTMPYAPMIGSSALTRLLGAASASITLHTSFAWPVRNGYVHNSGAGVAEIVLPSGSPCP